MDSSKKYLVDLVVRVSASETLEKKTTTYYKDKMSGLYGWDSRFVEDLQSEVRIKLLEKVAEGKFVFTDYVAGETEMAPPDAHFQKVLKWLENAFSNMCKERIRSRLPRQANGRGGDKMLFGSSYRESDFAGGLTTEINEKGEPLNTHEEYIASLTQPEEDDPAYHIDGATLLERIIAIVGADKAAIVEDRLAGFTDAELARKYGGSDQKYQKMFERVGTKMGLNPKDKAKQNPKRQSD